MSVEQRDPAVCSFSFTQEGKDEMTKASINLQDLRRRIYIKAKTETTWRFWGLYVHVCKKETLSEAYALAKNNNGAPGIDGVTFAAIEAQGVATFLEQIQDELVQRTYVPLPARSYFDNVRHDRLLAKVARRVDDADVLHLLKLMLKANGQRGVPQGGVISPLLSNLYLNEVDRMLERAKETTRYGKYTCIEYARFADDLVILIDAYRRHDWLMAAVEKRLREEFAELQVEINEEKSRNVDLGRGESFGFLGFDFRRMRSRRGVWRVNYTPKLKKRTALLRKLKDVFRRYQSQPVDRVVKLINPILRGWVNYFAVGHSSECFSFIQDWVEKKVRRHMGRAQNRKGFGWKRWSRQWLYETLRLFNGYRVRRPTSKVAPTG